MIALILASSSYKKAFKGAGLWIKNQRFIPNRFILCGFCTAIIFFFFYQKSTSVRYLQTPLYYIYNKHARLLSPIWAHTEVIKRMYSGTYNDNKWTVSEIHWALKENRGGEEGISRDNRWVNQDLNLV